MSASLPDATATYEERFAPVWRLIEEAIAGRVFPGAAFPGAALAVTFRGSLVAWRGFGRFTYEADSEAVVRECLWDLASLTKPLATTAMAMLLHERGRLPLEAPVVDWLPEFADASDTRRNRVTIAMLLAHSSGLPAHRKLYLEATGREAVLDAARRVPLEADPGTRAEYSDIGFIVLGELLERIAAEPLGVFCGREVFAPLKLNFCFARHPIRLADVPPTANDVAYRGRVIQGEVQDENASAMGGVAGHAGLFGDALSVARFAEYLLQGGPPLFRRETVALFTSRQKHPAATSRTLGWDTPSAPSQSGTRFSPRSFGHLGYTGTSLWCDPERGLSITLLTNRTWPNADNQAIKQLRPALHDAIVEALVRGEKCVES